MRLIGIELRQGSAPHLIKNLKENSWYPFGDYGKPTKDRLAEYKAELKNRSSNGLYKIDGVNEVNISCIVGKNGSGKSTIIDILLAIINNFAIKYVHPSVASNSCDLQLAGPLNASLYYELDGAIYEIGCGNTVVLPDDDINNPLNSSVTFQRDFVYIDKGDRDMFAKEMFYTMCLNYSLYSFNTLDYKKDAEQEDDEVWLHHLFHKNDAYLTPVVLNPFRDRGNMDINTENDLACQRLSVILLQLASFGLDFLPGYEALNLLYTHNTRYRKMPSKIKDWNGENYINETGQREMYQHEPFTIIYNYIRSEFIEFDSKCVLSDELFNYLAYKVIKICRNYVDFQNIFDVFKCARELSEGRDEKKVMDSYKDVISNVISEIEKTDTHITCKYRQTKKFLNDTAVYDVSKGEYGKAKRVPMNNVIKNNTKTIDYWEVYKLLPPPIYDLDIEFSTKSEDHKRDVVTFKSMSSGERQLLFSLSSAMYHIKNIESIKDGRNRIPYQNINIILDEVELYSHPEYQRDYIKNVLDRLSILKIDRIQSINILIVTHSPFILSDICKENTLYLEDGRPKETELTDSFGANYYDLLLNGFFLNEGGAVGAWASTVYKRVIEKIENTPDLPKLDQERYRNLFGDELIRNYIDWLILKKCTE